MRAKYQTLAEYLNKTGTTQEAVATRFGIDRSYVSLLASGVRQPGRKLAIRFQRELGVPVCSWDAEERAAS